MTPFMPNDTEKLAIGGYYASDDGNFCYQGYIDDLIIINHKALWTSDFTPPKNYLYGFKNIFLDSKNSAWGISYIH